MASTTPTAAAAAAASSQPVRVVLRVRPFLPSEAGSATTPCVSLLGSQPGAEVTVQLKDQYTSRNECYKLDAFFGQEDRVCEIFDQEVSAMIPGIFEGINATVFAYGATGSCKTYTMQAWRICRVPSPWRFRPSWHSAPAHGAPWRSRTMRCTWSGAMTCLSPRQGR